METDYSIIVPVYGSENALEQLHSSIVSFFQNKYSYEIIYVDDASTDNSWEVLKKIKSTAADTTIIRLSKNFGQHAATICGFKYSKGKFVISIDDDLEVHPDQIQKLIDNQKKLDSDLVYGVYKKQGRTAFRGLFTGIYKLMAKLEGPQKGEGSSFRMLKQHLAKKLASNHKQFVFIDELCLWYTKKIQFIAVTENPGYIEKKRYKVGGLLKMASNIIMFSSSIPLKAVTYIGIILATSNFLVGIYYIIRKFFFKTEVEGYTSLIVSILFSTGLIVLSLGVIALYISQILKSINNSPPYNEDEIIC